MPVVVPVVSHRSEWPIAPMKAALATRLPNGAAWSFEPKWDGFRTLVKIDRGRVDTASSTGKVTTHSWPWLIDPVIAAVGGATDGVTVLDGEVIAFLPDGHHSFQAVGRPDAPHAFVVFDLLVLDGTSLLGRPWRERRDLLEQAVDITLPLMLTPVVDDGEAMAEVTRSQRFEGVIAKRVDSLYVPGKRASSWVKVKWRFEQEMVIGGYKAGEGSRTSTFGSLLVGVHDNAGVLQFVGAVGTGFDERTLATVLDRLRPLASTQCPFAEVPKLPGRPVMHWVRPELVAQVSFAEWTDGGGIRAPVFVGLRDDKPAAEVVRESPMA